MSQIIPIYIPTYISDATYNPARVLPRLLFYNGMIDSQKWWIESGSSSVGGVTYEQNAFPYFDNYNVVSGSFPTTDSDSLLFFNEQAVYGETPTESLYSTYWENYVDLLYNPRTRLINAAAIIPLADYFKMELNDVVSWRGNYYHLRSIADFNLKNGECQIQLLGPILPDALPFALAPSPTTTTTTAAPTTTTSTTTTSIPPTTTSTTTTTTTTTTAGSATLAWSFSETGGAVATMDLYVNGLVVETRTNTSNGTYTVYVGDLIHIGLNQNQCSGGSTYANVSTTGILIEANCQNNGTVQLITADYTVASGDIGLTLSLDTFASCDGGCL